MHATQLYRLLLRMYPRRFREEFGDDIVQTFTDYYADVKARDGQAGFRFWTLLIADDLRNAGRQHLATLTEGDRTVTLSLGRLALTALILIPLFVLLSAASVMLALAIPHPPINGIVVPVALLTVDIVVPGAIGLVVSWGLAGLVQHLWSKRPTGRVRT